MCEGSDYLGQVSAFEFNLNTEIAKNLGCPILILGNADRRTIQEAIAPVKMSGGRVAIDTVDELYKREVKANQIV